MAENQLQTFPVTSPTTKKLPTCYRLVSYWANKTVTSWQQVVVMEFRKHDTTHRHNGLLHIFILPAPTCYGLNCYGETGVIDFRLVGVK